MAFEAYFHPLRDPNAGITGFIQGQLWDRGPLTSVFSQRRAFYSKFLIVSSGPDRELGIMRLDSYGLRINVDNLMAESMAIPINSPFAPAPSATASPPSAEAWQDDIVSHNLQTAGAAP